MTDFLDHPITVGFVLAGMLGWFIIGPLLGACIRAFARGFSRAFDHCRYRS